MPLRILVLPGDGIGPEITERALGNPSTRTRDIGGQLATDGFGNAISAIVAIGNAPSSGI